MRCQIDCEECPLEPSCPEKRGSKINLKEFFTEIHKEERIMKCEKCTHKFVCKYKSLFIEAQKSVDDLTVFGGGSGIKISNLDFVKNPVELTCRYYNGMEAENLKGVNVKQ